MSGQFSPYLATALLGLLIGLGCQMALRFMVLRQIILDIDQMQRGIDSAFEDLKARGGWYFRNRRRPEDSAVDDLIVALVVPASLIFLLILQLSILLITQNTSILLRGGHPGQIFFIALVFLLAGSFVYSALQREQMSLINYSLEKNLITNQRLEVFMDMDKDEGKVSIPLPILIRYKLIPFEITGELAFDFPTNLGEVFSSYVEEGLVSLLKAIKIYPLNLRMIVIENTSSSVSISLNQISIQPFMRMKINGGDQVSIHLQDLVLIEIEILGHPSPSGLGVITDLKA